MAASMDEDLDLVETDDYYAWLGLGKHATKEEIINAYRKFSRMYHPDKHAQVPELTEKAESLFNKIKKAYEVLNDPHRKAIYDTMGVKGLETEGWEVVSRTKTPQEILEEYEQLQREREERRLQQRTNPRGTITVGVNATDLFDRYHSMDALDYEPLMPTMEVSNMSISQSVECPLTTKNTATISGSLSSRNGTGSGNIHVALRRITSSKSWAEIDAGAGDGPSVALRGFHTLWSRAYGTMSGTLQFTPRGIRPVVNTMVAQQLDKNLQGRLVASVGGGGSSMSSVLVWDKDSHHIEGMLQLGIFSSFVTILYSHRFVEQEAKVKTALRLGTFGVLVEYGCEKKVTQFSTVGATLSVGIPLGVSLKLRLNRSSQTYSFPIHLSETIQPIAIFYGTVLPLAAYFVVKVLIINPFLQQQKQDELRIKKDANRQRMFEKRREAETALDLMQLTVKRSYEVEQAKGGLVVTRAIYGKLHGNTIRETESFEVTQPLQAMVKDSKLLIPDGTQLCEMPGFYDPCIGEEKSLCITYEFHHRQHSVTLPEKEKILLPSRSHLVDGTDIPPTPVSSRPSSVYNDNSSR